jgi:hypothetical protein
MKTWVGRTRNGHGTKFCGFVSVNVNSEELNRLTRDIILKPTVVENLTTQRRCCPRLIGFPNELTKHLLVRSHARSLE